MQTPMRPDGWQLAQINVGRLVAPQGDAQVQPFFDALDRINAVADASAGFICPGCGGSIVMARRRTRSRSRIVSLLR